MAEIEIDNFEELQEVEQEAQEVQEIPEPQEEKEQVSDKEKLMRSLVSDDDEVDEMTAASLRQMLDAAPRWFLSQW